MIDPTPIEKVSIAPGATIREAMKRINANTRGIVLVLDEDRRLLGTVTDGDIRRGVLAGIGLDAEVRILMDLRKSAAAPVTAPLDTSAAQLLHLMREHSIHQVPLLDAEGRAAGLAIMDDLIKAVEAPVRAVVMAGGFGKRLLPLTDETPKPMLHVGDKPILERIVNQLRDAGVQLVSMTTHFRPEVIQQHFGDGGDFGVGIQYVQENEPLGTAGALSLVEEQQEPLLVINGDILTDIDFRAMIAFHREHHADLTVAVREFDVEVPYGVVESDGAVVTGLQEKPVFKFFVNAGIYLLEPAVRAHIPAGRRFDMTDLITHLLSLGRPVVSFPVVEYWLDIGRHADYERAQEDVKSGKLNDI